MLHIVRKKFHLHQRNIKMNEELMELEVVFMMSIIRGKLRPRKKLNLFHVKCGFCFTISVMSFNQQLVSLVLQKSKWKYKRNYPMRWLHNDHERLNDGVSNLSVHLVMQCHTFHSISFLGTFHLPNYSTIDIQQKISKL